MGLRSFVKKTVKGVKKHVKKVAKTVKKVASKTWKAVKKTPAWKAISKIGGKVLETFGKISNKLGPVGMIGLSFVLGPLAGPALSSMWSSFGAFGQSLAASASTFAQAAGSVVNGVYNGLNWAGGTLGSVGDAISKGMSQVAKGEFAAGGDVFASNMAKAFTGEAGNTAMKEGINKAIAQNAAKLATEEVVTQNMIENLGGQTDFSQVGRATPDAFTASPLTDESTRLATTRGVTETGFTASPLAEQGARQAAVTQSSQAANTSLLSKAKSGAKAVSGALMDSFNQQDEQQGQMVAPTIPSLMSASADMGAAGFGGSQGASGFSLLTGVQGLEESVRNSTQLVTRGLT